MSIREKLVYTLIIAMACVVIIGVTCSIIQAITMSHEKEILTEKDYCIKYGLEYSIQSIPASCVKYFLEE